MVQCENPRGTLYHRELRVARQAGCGRWRCKACGAFKAKRVAGRFARMGADYLVTLTLPPGRGWPTPENYSYLQESWRSFSRWLQRHKLVAAFGWVGEVSERPAACGCPPVEEMKRACLNCGLPNPVTERTCYHCLAPLTHWQDCQCGAFGNRLHRHMMVRLAGAANRFGRKRLPYSAMQAAAKRCGLGTIDCRPIFSGQGAARYVSKYLTKSIGLADAGRRRFAMNVRIEELKDSGWHFSWLRVATIAVEQLGAIAVDWDATYWSAGLAPP